MPARGEAGLSDRRLRQGIALFGALQLLLGLSMVLAPGTFFDSIADFGERNDHYLRDYATYYLVTGIALLLAVNRSSWRVPVLFVVAVQYGLHALNHLFDIGDASPGWVGPFDFITLLFGTALLGYLMHASARQRSERRA